MASTDMVVLNAATEIDAMMIARLFIKEDGMNAHTVKGKVG